MKRSIMIIMSIFMLHMTALLTGCERELGSETMQLLDEKLAEIRISSFEAWDDMNDDALLSFKDAEAVRAFEKVIRTARKHPENTKQVDPDYDVMVIYAEQYPIHAIKLWLGEDGEESVFSYAFGNGKEAVYVATVKHSDRIRELMKSAGRS